MQMALGQSDICESNIMAFQATGDSAPTTVNTAAAAAGFFILRRFICCWGASMTTRTCRNASSGALLVASYSRLLATHYESDMLRRALPFMIKAQPALLASGTYYVAESDPGNLVATANR